MSAIALFASVDILGSCIGGLLGNRFDAGVLHAAQQCADLLDLKTFPKNHHVLNAMHEAFAESLGVMAKACADANVTVQDYGASQALNRMVRSGSLTRMHPDASNVPVALLQERVEAIYGHDGINAAAAATASVITIVESAMGVPLTDGLRAVFRFGHGTYPGWAGSFELFFADKVKSSTPLFRILQFDRSNAIYARAEALVELAEAQSARIQGLIDAIADLRAEMNAGFAKTTAQNEAILAAIAALSAQISDQREAAPFAVATEELAASDKAEDQGILAEIVDGGPEVVGDSLMAQVHEGKRRDAETARRAARIYAPFARTKAKAAYEQAVLLDPTDVWSWIELGRLKADYETLAAARTCFGSALQHVTDERDRSVLHNELGAVLVAEGNLAEALHEFQAGLGIVEALARADTSSASLRRDISVSLIKVGDVMVAQGRLDDALERFDRSLEIAESLAAADPSSASLRRDISVSLNRVGDVMVAQGRLTEALKRFERGLEIMEALARADPSSASLRRDISVSLIKVGDVMVEQGRLDDALKRFERGLEIMEALARVDPSSASLRRDISVSLDSVGDVMVAQGRLDDALERFERGLGIREALAEADPSSASLRRDISVSFNNVGDVMVAQGRLDDALARFERGLGIREALAEADPSSASLRRDISVSFNKVGDVMVAQGRLDDALTRFERGLGIREALARADPSSASNKRDVFVSLIRVAGVLAELGRSAEALELARQAEGISAALVALAPDHAVFANDLAIVRGFVAELERGA
ncbi:tetratricopeptide repeat protein [Novosphingobium sp. NDB2Meth1]|uniref:tetratricopeptide repeat protein n=1 Tax=Novosphingobium sp. NDB2Meth1 TaxID=1892847 RepID=UPI00092FECC6|nr:tetratricopeptide repeat protein [Novosphingobium sp. NDB2Meth1]